MTKFYRLLALGALVGLGVWLSGSSQGEPTDKGQPLPTNPIAPAAGRPAPNLEDNLADSKFAQAPLHVYESLKGDRLIGLQVQPKLPAAPARKRDYVILVSTSASQAGAGWMAGNLIAQAFVETARDGDRIALWAVSTPEATKALTDQLVEAKSDAPKLKEALNNLKKRYPNGASDLKDALAKAIDTFGGGDHRQRVLLFLGDGQSIANPLSHEDRAALCKQMVDRKIAFFAVPLGLQLDPANLHGFATGTGGAVMRTHVTQEKITDALKRYQDALAAPIMYGAQIKLPAEVTEHYPRELPPLRGDVPTLVVGRMKQAANLEYTVTGTVGGLGAPTTLNVSLPVPAPELDNFFLIGMVDQWARAQNQPALLRADRALMFAYNQTKVLHKDLLVGAQLAIERNELDGAARLFAEAKQMSPRDGEADAGLRVLAKLKDGTLTREQIRKQMTQVRVGDQIKKVNGAVQIAKANFIELAALQPEAQKDPKAAPAVGGLTPAELQRQRDRVILEEQKMMQMVEESLRQARRELNTNPEGTVEMLRNTLMRVQDHPDLGDRVREALASRLQTSLRESATQGKQIQLRQQEQQRILAMIRDNADRAAQNKTHEDRQLTQFRRFKEEMYRARFEEKSKQELMAQMVAMARESQMRGQAPPVSLQAVYDITLDLYHLQQQKDMRRKREERFLATLLEVDKSHIPYPDEPGIYYPPLATWKAITDTRKEKYEVSSLPDDDKARSEANALSRMLQEVIDMKDFQNPGMTLKEALGLFYEKFAAKGKELPILVDSRAFLDESPDAGDIYESPVKFPPYPKTMAMATALQLALSQVQTGNATYLIRRSFIEITTNDKALKDRVIRVYPVGELVIPVNALGGQQQFQQNSTQTGGGGFGGFNGGFGGGIQGGFGISGGGQGFVGGQVSGAFNGGGFQGGFNGSLGIMGATQAVTLIELVTRVVDPGNWFYVSQAQPFNASQNAGAFANPFGGGGLGGAGFGGGGAGGLGQNAPPVPVSQGGPADIQTSNTIDFFPPALALIIRAPSRIHTSISGGVIGGKYTKKEVVMFEAQRGGKDVIADAGKILKPGQNNPAVANVNKNKNKIVDDNVIAIAKKGKDLDATKIWEDAFEKGGIEPGLVIATADFLFEMDKPAHVAEFLKANLRHGVVVRPWVYEALATALEATNGDPDEIRRARLSAVALDPTDAQGFLQAARSMAEGKQYTQALAFCRQAALLEPNLAQPYVQALTYAELAKDSKSMEWAAGKLVSQDWPTDNPLLQEKAANRLGNLAQTLRQEQRGSEADRLNAALQMLRQRDLVVTLTWDTAAGETAGLELQVKEPTGSVCSTQQKQTPGGGIFAGGSLTGPNRITYLAAQGFSGDYEITVRRVWGKTIGSKARLEIVQHLGTPKERRHLEIVRLDQNSGTIKLNLQGGRRVEMASVPPSGRQRVAETQEESTALSAAAKLRGMAFGDFTGAAGVRVGGASTVSTRNTPSALAQADTNQQSAVRGSAVPTTGQLRSSEKNGLEMVLRPVFDNMNTQLGRRPGLVLPGIPGGGQ